MSTYRVIVTAAPTPNQVTLIHQMLTFAALHAEGHRAIDRGAYDPAEVSARAEVLAERLVSVIVDEAPTDESTARMIAAALSIAECPARVVPA